MGARRVATTSRSIIFCWGERMISRAGRALTFRVGDGLSFDWLVNPCLIDAN